MELPTTPTSETIRLTTQFIQGLFHLLKTWDKSAAEHGQRVARFAVQLARKRGWRDHDLLILEWGAQLHDVGKVCIPAAILLREGPLTAEDWTVIKRHPVFGSEMLKPVETLVRSAGIVLCHHENWDGSGYPSGLKGNEISPGARIVAVAEVWDALTSNPADRSIWPKERVVAYIRDHAGSKFDPSTVATFLEITGSIG